MNATPRVFLVDDQPAVLKGLSRLLASAGFEVAPFGSAQDFLASGIADLPGCLVLDLAMPGMGGLELQQALAARASTLPVIFLTGHGDISASVKAMKHGAVDFLTKPPDADRLITAVQAAIEANRLARLERAEHDEILARLATLSPRERDVLDQVVTGRLNKQVAGDLDISEKTVKLHRGKVMSKMKVATLPELVRVVSRAGILNQASKRRENQPI
jgi:FixJ family two-component response regulator